MEPILEALTETNRAEAEAYLAKHEETSQFLINNLREYGHKLVEHHNSGNFKLIRSGGKVAAVFYLSRRGNLVAQAEQNFSEIASPIILDSCRGEPFAIHGILGGWQSVAPIWERFKKANPNFKASYESKEILYSLPLERADPRLVRDSRVRPLVKDDFDLWLPNMVAYRAEVGLPDRTTMEQKRADFARATAERTWWGMFQNGALVSHAGLNSRGQSVGQVGGVFTPQESRQRGYSRATMLHLLADCRDLHGHGKSILFTSETDVPAQRLYESIGYGRIGFYGIIQGA